MLVLPNSGILLDLITKLIQIIHVACLYKTHNSCLCFLIQILSRLQKNSVKVTEKKQQHMCSCLLKYEWTGQGEEWVYLCVHVFSMHVPGCG